MGKLNNKPELFIVTPCCIKNTILYLISLQVQLHKINEPSLRAQRGNPALLTSLQPSWIAALRSQ
ncbi:MAG: hypothetical protein A3H31_03190 [Gallionellales bacterium RIFCSPLOWO2_02_FULL_57_47]|nr:MAG: hypothetical protein A3H31_03190 [Gallionellales bacterium RIFCSPLOWO2_02_FULL_57_47]